MSPTVSKRCPRCGDELPAEHFRKCRSARDGLQCWCRACHRAYRKTPKGREQQRQYQQGEAGREATRRHNAQPAARKRKQAYKKTVKGKVAAHRYNTSPKGRAATRRYKATPDGIAAERRYLTGPRGRETVRRAQFRYHQTPRGVAALRRAKSQPGYAAKQRALGDAWAASNQEKRRAHQAVKRALKRGDLVRPAGCQRCPRMNVRLDAHHDHGYENALDIIWLCGSCHRLAHTRAA